MEQWEKNRNDLFRKLEHITCFFDLISEICLEIQRLTFRSWWRSVSNIGKGDFLRLKTMHIIIDDDNMSNTEEIELEERHPKELQDRFEYQMYLLKSFDSTAEAELKSNQGLFSNDHINHILQGKRFTKLQDYLKVTLAKLVIWGSFKIIAKQWLRIVGEHTTKDCRDSVFTIDIDAVYSEYQSKDLSHKTLKALVDIYNQYKDLESWLDNIPNDPYINEMDKETSQEFCIRMNKLIASAKMGFDEVSKYLFLILNTDLLPSQTKNNIVNTISNSNYKKAYQIQYYQYRLKYPDAVNWHFYNSSKYLANIKLPYDFDKLKYAYSENSLMRKTLTRTDLYRMYAFLTTKKYMSPKTDICDFSFALTGKPRKQEDIFKKINWIDKNIQTLAIFLGFLKNENDTTYWSQCTNYFIYNGKEITRRQLSSPFSKLMSNPEARPEDWELLKTAVTGIEENNNN